MCAKVVWLPAQNDEILKRKYIRTLSAGKSELEIQKIDGVDMKDFVKGVT